MAKAKLDTEIPGARAAGGDVSAGVPVERNYDENPSFEVNTLGVTVSYGTGEKSATKSLYGSYSYLVTQTGAYVGMEKRRIEGRDSKFPVIAGEVYVHFVAVQMETGDTGLVWINMDWYDADEVYISSDPSASYSPGDSAWTEAQVVAVAPANAAFVVPHIIGVFDSPGDAVYVDGQELRWAAAYKPPYIDGDQELCVWEGTAHLSASLREPALSRPPIGSGVSAEFILLARAEQSRE